MKLDLHNHTSRCNHATGTLEEYISKAIEHTIDIYGFSCHAPIKQGIDPNNRMALEDISSYIEDIKNIKKKYQKKIKILAGFEVDYLKGDYIYDEVLDQNIDYLIGSVHFIPQNNSKFSIFNPKFWGFDNPEFIDQYEKKDIDKIWVDYFDSIKDMAKSKKFDIVGHLDLIKIFGFKPKREIIDIATPAIQEIKNSNMTVEINSAGLRKPACEQYPSKELLKLCFKYDIDITFGSDAHKTDDISKNFEICLKLAKDVGYKKAVYFENRVKKVVSI
ncbi:MAG: histidinol phosphate phosphatase [Campylobacteraceae bacterium 4484_166]|nr:MAG: histidinol phosphate phosphatase [Campylobacteraceae bacterium 4484_166]